MKRNKFTCSYCGAAFDSVTDHDLHRAIHVAKQQEDERARELARAAVEPQPFVLTRAGVQPLASADEDFWANHAARARERRLHKEPQRILTTRVR